jgi:hypothetical protein
MTGCRYRFVNERLVAVASFYVVCASVLFRDIVENFAVGLMTLLASLWPVYQRPKTLVSKHQQLVITFKGTRNIKTC